MLKETIVRIVQPENETMGAQIVALFKIFSYLGRPKKEEKIIFDFSDLQWAQPLFLLPICCLIRELKRKRFKCVVKPPKNESLLGYLETILFPNGFIPKLKNNISEFLWQYFKDKTYLPIIIFPTIKNETTLKIQEKLLDSIYDLLSKQVKLNDTGKGAIAHLINEAVNNIYEHAQVDRGWLFAQYYPKKNYLDICLLDAGISLLGSYRRHNILISEHVTAVKYALSGLSTKPEKGRGYGIYTSVKLLTQGLKGKFILISGNALFYQNGKQEKLIKVSKGWRGTIVGFRIPKPLPRFNLTKYLE